MKVPEGEYPDVVEIPQGVANRYVSLARGSSTWRPRETPGSPKEARVLSTTTVEPPERHFDGGAFKVSIHHRESKRGPRYTPQVTPNQGPRGLGGRPPGAGVLREPFLRDPLMIERESRHDLGIRRRGP